MIYPHNFEEKVGFGQIRQLVKQKCLSTLGQDRTGDMAFSDSRDEICLRLRQTGEFMRLLQSGAPMPDQFFFDVRQPLRRIRVEGLYLDTQEVHDLRRSLETIRDVVRFLCGQDGGEEGGAPYPELRALAAGVTTFPQVISRIDALLDKFGRVKDSASAALSGIRRELAAAAGSVSRSLISILRAAQAEGYVDKDAAPTVRDGRLVIPVPPGVKRKIRGIVHDESATGKTVYIEPTEVVEANNRIRELEGEERREIIRILTDFSAMVRPLVPDLLESYTFLAEIDFIRAKASLAMDMGACVPEVGGSPEADWTEAVHPLLRTALERCGRTAVPLDIRLDGRQRILLISGPNAGGKSVCLKTVGLLQYMLQCGMPVPLNGHSRAGVFGSIFIDIGDEQSIEDDLSTYSSHLTNMKMMLRHADSRSLILIDEFGGGTEPQIGGAIAEALLRRFDAKGALGVITTHYSNLKHYAEEHEGVANGAMLYDRHEMRPLFRLQQGYPGSSFAVEIARKIGLPEDVIADASEIVGSDYIQSDKYLQDIARDKRYWETKRQNVRRREKQLEETIARYERDADELEAGRKEILRKSKEEAARLLQEANAMIERTIRSIKEAQAERERTKEVRRELADFRRTVEDAGEAPAESEIEKKMEQLRRRQEARRRRRDAAKAGADASKEQRPVVADDYVRIKGQQAVGQVLEVNGKTAVVVFGLMKTSVAADRLEIVEQGADRRTAEADGGTLKQGRQGGTPLEKMHEKRLEFKHDIDVRGMRGDEAVQAVTYFIDDAILLGVSRVRILHGTGSGILRTLIRQYLATVPGVTAFRDEHVQFGGAGITVVDF